MSVNESFHNAAQPYTDWLITTNRFVAFLDIMGFKDMVMRKSHKDIYSTINEVFSLTMLFEKNSSVKGDIYITKFSDSIVIFSRTNDFKNLFSFCHAVRLFFAGSMVKGLPLKGAIAYGEISVDISNSIFFGQPLVDANVLQEDVNYYGVVCHNSFEKAVKELDQDLFLTDKVEMFFKVKTALKSGLITHLNMDWHDDVSMWNEMGEVDELLERIYLEVSGKPRRYIDNTIEMYQRFRDYKNKKVK